MPFTYECAGCGQPFTRPSQVKTRAFCSRECYHAATIVRPDHRECLGCGVIFNPCKNAKSGPANSNRKYCTRECFEASVRKWLNCERCGKRFDTGRAAARGKRNHLQYCSTECRWPPTYLDCKTCGVRFRVSRSAAEGARQFCSFACYRRYTGETMLECRVRRALESLGVDFAQEYAIAGWSIDFALTAHNVAIEADGDYWHSRTAARDARRDAQLTRVGWHVVRLSETELNATREPGRLILDRLRAATGLELADLASSGEAREALNQQRRVFHLNHRRPGRIRMTRAALDGQMTLWGDG